MSTTFMPTEVYAGRRMQDAGYTEPASATRIASIDVVRGAVMVLMAIDHVRVYAGVPAGGPTAAVGSQISPARRIMLQPMTQITPTKVKFA